MKFDNSQAKEIGEKLGIDWNTCDFGISQFKQGLNSELEHGSMHPDTNVTNDDPLLTGKIAYAHLKEFPDYYARLKKMEKEAKKHWKQKKTVSESFFEMYTNEKEEDDEYDKYSDYDDEWE